MNLKPQTVLYSGVANSIVGTANERSILMALYYGCWQRNNKLCYISSGTPDDGGNSAKELAEKLRTAVRDANGGGATMALGGGNKADPHIAYINDWY